MSGLVVTPESGARPGQFLAVLAYEGEAFRVGATYPPPDSDEREEAVRDALTLAFAAVAAQACLAPGIEVQNRRLPAGAGDLLGSVSSLLYGSHAYSQRRASWPQPQVRLRDDRPTLWPPGSLPSTRGCALLWSGGKDALAGLLVLRANEFDVRGVHVKANDAVVENERRAALAIGKTMALSLAEASVDWSGIAQLTERHSTRPVAYPSSNQIPFGRDLVLASVATAALPGSLPGWVALGLENELLTKEILFAGEVVMRHDVQSLPGLKLASELLHLTTGCRAFSPIASLPELAVMKFLLTAAPRAWDDITSCFWADWCGECPKCVRYFLAEAVVGVSRIPFTRSPLANGAPGVRAVAEAVEDETLPFRETQVLGLYALLDRGALETCPEIRELLRAAAPTLSRDRDRFRHYVESEHPMSELPPPIAADLQPGLVPIAYRGEQTRGVAR